MARSEEQTKINKEETIKDMKKLAIIAAAVALMAFGRSAQAQIVVTDGTGILKTAASGYPSTVNVNYFVALTGSTYTYVYEFVDPTTNPQRINAFDVDASFVSSVLSGSISSLFTSSVNTKLATDFGSSPFFSALTASTSQNLGIEVDYNFSAGGSPYEFAFTSPYAPTLGVANAIDGTVWNDGSGSPAGTTLVPVPVPEASTVMAGALMLLPLGIGAVRALRKERVA